MFYYIQLFSNDVCATNSYTFLAKKKVLLQYRYKMCFMDAVRLLSMRSDLGSDAHIPS